MIWYFLIIMSVVGSIVVPLTYWLELYNHRLHVMKTAMIIALMTALTLVGLFVLYAFGVLTSAQMFSL